MVKLVALQGQDFNQNSFLLGLLMIHLADDAGHDDDDDDDDGELSESVMTSTGR